MILLYKSNRYMQNVTHLEANHEVPAFDFLVFAACVSILPAVHAQSSDVTMSFLPTVTVPIGPTLGDGLPFFDIGGGGSLRGELAPGFARWLFGRAFIDYELLPINGSSESLSVVYGGGALGASFSPAPRFALRASAGGGCTWP
jgi:hypothetical protein